MLSQIDESDLQEFLDSGPTISEETSVPSVVLEENETSSVTPANEEEPAAEEGQENASAGNLAGILAILLLAGAGLELTTILRFERKRLRPRKKIPKGWNSATDWRQWMNGKKTRTIMNNDLSGEAV